MAIIALGYLGVESDKTGDWSEFASKLLGMQEVDRGAKSASFRMDDRKQRFVISGESGNNLSFVGWEVAQKEDLQMYASRLDAADVPVTLAKSSLADQRFVEELLYFDDPAGNRIELFVNPMIDDTPFTPGRRHSGFKTGPFGLGHAVLHVTDAESLADFYTSLLDFKLSDYGRKPIPMFFFHVNGRHHSFALIGSGQSGLHHFMVEYNSLDDVGQGYDLALQNPDRIAYTLGRHTNDWMTSFYAHSPSGFFVEKGWGGQIIDTDTWQAVEHSTGPSFWGHDRPYLPDDQRNAYRDLRLSLAKQGKQAPQMIDCPWLYDQLHNQTR